jgi:uncharacterized protein (TIGR02391 family)
MDRVGATEERGSFGDPPGDRVERASRLREDLSARRMYPDVLGFCRPELLANNYFRAVPEAPKKVADEIRKRSGLIRDGSELIDVALAPGKAGIPLLAFNTLQTESERSEQSGLCALIKGMFGTFPFAST